MDAEHWIVLACIVAFLYLVLTMPDASAEQPVIAVMSRRCGHCRRAWRDIESIQAERSFVVHEPADIDPELEAELRGAGYSGRVPFFYSPKSHRAIEGYRPASEILSALL
jgi:hypothetical protein